ncbi:MAG: single-stranded DNA-binding protein [Thermoguttaceae bacterium]|nr:single-stranded DNA-binding protein [Thermoguttaceae bacterium]
MDRKGQFVDVVAWGRSAEIVRDYTKKGSTILVEGRLKQETWEREGEKRSRVKIVVDRVVLLSSNVAAVEQMESTTVRRKAMRRRPITPEPPGI